MVIHYLGPVAAGLDFLNCHQHSFEGRIVGFQHADVKPSNLLIVGNQTKEFVLRTPKGPLLTLCHIYDADGNELVSDKSGSATANWR